jgi:hypothetical protein
MNTQKRIFSGTAKFPARILPRASAQNPDFVGNPAFGPQNAPKKLFLLIQN